MSDYRSPINCLRGVAALIVLAYHFHNYTDFPWREHFPFFHLLYIGVDFFFLLSGLILAHVYLSRFRAFDPALYWTFLSRRIARLFPAHAAVLLALLLVPPLYYGSLAEGPLTRYSLAAWFEQLTMIRLWFFPEKLVWNTPAWSIGAEMFAYVFLFPLYAYFLRGQNGRADGRRGDLLPAAFLFALGLLGVLALGQVWGSLNSIRGGGGLMRITLEFAAGVGLYGLLSRLESRGPGWNALALASLLALILLAASHPAPGAPPRAVTNDSLVFLAIVGLVAGVYNARGRLAAILSSRPLFYLGEISYGIYIAHIPVLRAMAELTDRFLGPGDRGLLFCLVALPAAVAAGALLHHLVERPARVYLRRKLNPKPLRPEPA